jgi:hypothetical protein
MRSPPPRRIPSSALVAFLGIALLISWGATGPASAQDAVDVSARLEAVLDHARARYGFPGATAAVALPDGTVATAATGLADVELGQDHDAGDAHAGCEHRQDLRRGYGSGAGKRGALSRPTFSPITWASARGSTRCPMRTASPSATS